MILVKATTDMNPEFTPIQQKVQDYFADKLLKEYKRGDTIVIANQDPEGVMYLEKGIVEQYDITPEGAMVIVNIFKAPAFFPMSWAMNKTPNRYFFGAQTDTSLRIDDPAKTILFLQNNPDVLYELLARVFRGSDALLRRLVLATSSVSSKRLMFELLLEAQRFGETVGEHQKLIHIKQTILAARSGLARETVSREIRQLEKQGIILRYKHGMLIHTGRIEQVLDFTYAA